MASRVVDFLEGSTVGNGLRPMLRAGFADPKFLAAQEAFFEQCDADEVLNFDGLLRVVFREVVAGGECFVRMRERDMDAPENRHLVAPLQLQAIPGEMVPTNDHTLETVCGIKTNGLGRRIAYKFYNKHPGEFLMNNPAAPTLSFVPSSSVCHVFRKGEPGQIRGEPWLVRGLIALHDLDAYQDAELVRKKMAAMPVFFIETPTDLNKQPGPAGVSDGTDGNPEGTPLDTEGNVWIQEDPIAIMPELKPGGVVPVAPGWKVNPSIPADVGPNYDVFVRRQLQRICAGVNVPYELVTGDTPVGANERMMRIRVQAYYQLVRQWRAMLVRQFCTPVWNRFIDALVSNGWQPTDGTVDDYRRVEWIGDPVPQTHPTQDVQADIMAVRAGFKTRAQVIRERGGDPDRMLAQRAAECAASDELGIFFDSDARFNLWEKMPAPDADGIANAPPNASGEN
jgi:lambda family phage portal protein